MSVTDASAVLEVLLGTTAALDIQQRLSDGGESLHAPHLLDLEIAQVLRRYVLGGELTPQRGKQALTVIEQHEVFRPCTFPLVEPTRRPKVRPQSALIKRGSA